MFKLGNGTGTIYFNDGFSLAPPYEDPRYFEYVDWINAGNTPEVIADGVPVEKWVSKLEFMERFTDDELAVIYTAAKQSVQVEIWLEKLKMTSGDINLSDPRTMGSVNALEAIGLVGVGRAGEILA